MGEFDTIAAISTALNDSGISIIRVSGNDSIEIVDKIFKGSKSLVKCDSHTINYGHIIYNEKIIDEVLVSIFMAPRTFTKENVVEINCHGGVIVTRKVLEAVLNSGARMADPGEFTKRAFLNGRIDLSQAESVMDLINSKNEFAMNASIKQLNGVLSKEIKSLRENIIYEIAYIESALDDPEHISLEGYNERLSTVIENVADKINILIKDSDNGILLKEGINTVIIGKPNAGKSSLLNFLAKKDKAIVTDIPGTTRDILEEQININGITLNIIDTAGIRDTENVVEKIGVDKALSLIDEADFVIYVVDSSVELDENDMLIINRIKDEKAVCLLNKSDLKPIVKEENISNLIDKKIISISVKEGNGISELEEEIKKMFFKGEIASNNELVITNMRHKDLLCKALNSLELVKNSLENNMPEDFYSIDLMDSYTFLGKIIGESVEDDLVNEIFSKFCMGK